MLTLLRLMCSRFSHGGHAVGAGLVRVLATTAVAPCAWGPRSPRIAHGPCSPHRSFPPRGPACLACTRRVRETPPPRRSRGVGGRARNKEISRIDPGRRNTPSPGSPEAAEGSPHVTRGQVWFFSRESEWPGSKSLIVNRSSLPSRSHCGGGRESCGSTRSPSPGPTR